MKVQKTLLIVLAVLMVIGAGVSADLTYVHYRVTTDLTGEYQSFCNINAAFDCDAVAQSPWGRFLGVPIAFFGMLTYLFCLALVWVRWRNPPGHSPHASIYLLWIAVASVLYSLFLAYICYVEIGTWCIMCMILYAVNFLTLPLAIAVNDVPLRRHYAAKMADLRWVWSSGLRRAVLVGGLLVVVAIVGAYNWHNELVRQERLTVVMSKLRQLPSPIAPVGDTWGSPDAKMTIIVFSDYQCPFCKVMEDILEELVEHYPQLRVVRRDFPLDMACNPMVRQPFHGHACAASLLKNCADELGKGKEMHRHLLNNQRQINDEFLRQSVDAVGLDLTQVESCLAQEDARFRLRQDISAGIEVGLDGTPALVVNGTHMVMGGMSRDELVHLIENFDKR